MSRIFRPTAQVLLYILALAVLWAGLGIGLQHNPTIGTITLFAALTIAAANTYWIFRPKRQHG